MNRNYLTLALLGLLFSLGCGPATSSTGSTLPQPEVSPLDALRERAAAAPRDADLQFELAEAELLHIGGDSTRVLPAIDGALALRPDDLSLLLMKASLLDMRGELAGALPIAIRVISLARQSADPQAPFHAEMAFTLLRGLRGELPGYLAVVTPLVDEILRDPGTLGSSVVRLASFWRMGQHWRAGDHAGVAQTANALGCVTEGWRAVGPFGPLRFAGFDQTLPAQGVGPLAEEYDLGPGRGETDTFDGDITGCIVSFRNKEQAGGGTTVAETFIEVEHAGTHLVQLSASGSFKLYVDGEEVAIRDRRTHLTPTWFEVPLELTAGRHEIEIKITTSRHASVRFILDRAGRFAEGYEPSRGSVIPEPQSRFERVLFSLLKRSRGDSLAARETFRPIASMDLPAYALDVYRMMVEGDPFISPNARTERTNTQTQLIAERDPLAVYAALGVARQVQGDVEGIAAIRNVAERWPDIMAVQELWAGMLQEQGRLPEAEALLQRLRAAVPDNCRLNSSLRNLLSGQMRMTEADALIDVMMACDARSLTRFQSLFSQRRWEAVTTEIDRLAPLLDSEDRVRQMRLNLALATGNTAQERELRAAIAEDAGVSWRETLRQIDGLLARGQRARAVRDLERALEEHPERMAALRHTRRDLTGRDDLEQYRQDGQEVIARYEAGEIRHDSATEVLVLDYMVTRIYPDGSARNLVHQIYRIQSEEAVERLGQISLPGELLTLRSIKPDGRILEPEAIAGLDSIPMTELAIGDYVETEYVTSQGPLAGGGYRSNGWVFDSTQHPFAFSQLIAVVPDGMDVTAEAIGGTPAATERTEGEFKIFTWTMEHVPSRPPEPHAVALPPYRPTLIFGVQTENAAPLAPAVPNQADLSRSWDNYFTLVSEGLAGNDHFDPAAQRLVQRLIGEETSPPRIAERLHGWVTEHVEPVSAFAESAPAMVATKRGDRTRVLRYLLSLAGLDARLVLVRQFGNMNPGPLLRPELYNASLVQVVPEQGPSLFIWGDGRHASWDFIPPNMRGQAGIVVLGNGIRTEVRVPDGGPDLDAHEVAMEIQFDGDDAIISVVERFNGAAAFSWRNELERIPAAELERVLSEAYVARLLAGGEVESIEVRGATDPSQPFELRYASRVRNFGRRAAGGGVLLPSLFAANLMREYASLPNRTTSMNVTGQVLHLQLRVRNAMTPQVPQANLEGPGVRYSRTTQQDGADVVVERRLRIEPQIVTASDYAAFAELAREISQYEAMETPLRR